MRPGTATTAAPTFNDRFQVLPRADLMARSRVGSRRSGFGRRLAWVDRNNLGCAELYKANLLVFEPETCLSQITDSSRIMNAIVGAIPRHKNGLTDIGVRHRFDPPKGALHGKSCEFGGLSRIGTVKRLKSNMPIGLFAISDALQESGYRFHVPGIIQIQFVIGRLCRDGHRPNQPEKYAMPFCHKTAFIRSDFQQC